MVKEKISSIRRQVGNHRTVRNKNGKIEKMQIKSACEKNRSGSESDECVVPI